MGSEPNGGPGRIPAQEQLNIVALVIYIPEPLGLFLDDLRRELVPGCEPHAHVSVLPPRPLAGDWRAASGQARVLAQQHAPFEIVLTEIRTFPVTDVIYIEVGAGAGELRRMHAAINTGALAFEEPFPYHPHVTLAQKIARAEVAEVEEMASRRWQEYRGPRAFRAERATFVQNTLSDCWVDLAEFSFGAAVVLR